MPDVTIYTTPFCSYCHAAKALFSRRGIAFREIDVSRNPSERQRMMVQAHGRRTVPQVFVDGVHLGGSREIFELDRNGRLDSFLGRP
jgi:glutaredoxin 3